MTKDHAIQLMQEDKLLTHHYFSREEWITIENQLFKFEDGYLCEFDEFWKMRQGKEWQDNWRLFEQIY